MRKRFFAIIIGIVFLVAGLFKLVDPVGTGLIFDGYFNFFNIPFLHKGAEEIGLIMSILEASLGVALITGIYKKFIAIASSILILFFTFITLVLVIFNPTMDCGCFGKVIQLTHLQTFIKNIILCAFALLAFLPFKNFSKPKDRKYIVFSVVIFMLFALGVYSLNVLPLKDFTAFKIGTELILPEEIASSTAEPEYESFFIYEKDGKQKKFDLESLPDSTWTYVDTKTIAKTENPSKFEYYPILSFSDVEGNYKDKLALKGHVMVISIYDAEKISKENYEQIAELISNLSKSGFKSLLLVSSTYGDFYSVYDGFHSLLTQLGLEQECLNRLLSNYYQSDYKTLISLNRSNGGATYINNGLLIKKWSIRFLPNEKTLEKIKNTHSDEYMLSKDTHNNIFILSYIFILFIMLVFI